VVLADTEAVTVAVWRVLLLLVFVVLL